MVKVGTGLGALRAAAQVYYNYTGQAGPCFGFGADTSAVGGDLRADSADNADGKARGGPPSGWSYQTCTEVFVTYPCFGCSSCRHYAHAACAVPHHVRGFTPQRAVLHHVRGFTPRARFHTTRAILHHVWVLHHVRFHTTCGFHTTRVVLHEPNTTCGALRHVWGSTCGVFIFQLDCADTACRVVLSRACHAVTHMLAVLHQRAQLTCLGSGVGR
jgi:hypothetical protein